MGKTGEAKPSDTSVPTVNVHSMPFGIDYTGSAKVNDYFKSSIRKEHDTDLTASFRGRPLRGKTIELPTGYTGYTCVNTKKDDDSTGVLVRKGKFSELTYWNLDRVPTSDDSLQKLMQWLQIARKIHGTSNDDIK